jgi:hypothetical protein
MKHFLLAITAIFFGLTTSFSQETNEVSTDSLPVIVKVENNVEKVNEIINNWQLLSHETFDNYPENKTGDSDFSNGKEFLDLAKNGAYSSILHNKYIKGFWLQNNNLMFFKKKVTSKVEI